MTHISNLIETPQTLNASIALLNNNIKFIRCQDSKTVIWEKNEEHYIFNDLPYNIYQILKDALLSDKQAIFALDTFFSYILNENRKVELYTYFFYSDLI